MGMCGEKGRSILQTIVNDDAQAEQLNLELAVKLMKPIVLRLEWERNCLLIDKMVTLFKWNLSIQKLHNKYLKKEMEKRSIDK